MGSERESQTMILVYMEIDYGEWGLKGKAKQ